MRMYKCDRCGKLVSKSGINNLRPEIEKIAVSELRGAIRDRIEEIEQEEAEVGEKDANQRRA